MGGVPVLLALLAGSPAGALQTAAPFRHALHEQAGGAGYLLQSAVGRSVLRPSCYVSPSMERTYIFIRDLDSDGNPIGQLGGGWVDYADQAPVISRSGNIVISYRQSSSDKAYKTDALGCAGGNVISVP